MHDLQDKGYWLDYGEDQEFEFINNIVKIYNIKRKVCINPDKKYNPTLSDLVIDVKGKKIFGDLKTVRTPFYTASRYGFDPNNCITFNEKDYFSYMQKYYFTEIIKNKKAIPDPFVLFFHVVWPESSNYGTLIDAKDGLWTTTIEDIHRLTIQEKTRWHEYKNRKNDDCGNCRVSMIISLSDLKKVRKREELKIK